MGATSSPSALSLLCPLNPPSLPIVFFYQARSSSPTQSWTARVSAVGSWGLGFRSVTSQLSPMAMASCVCVHGIVSSSLAFGKRLASFQLIRSTNGCDPALLSPLNHLRWPEQGRLVELWL